MSASRLTDDVDRRDQHRQRLHDRYVVVADAVDQRAADARVVEDGLDDDHAAGEVGEVDRDHLERRAERVRQRVPRISTVRSLRPLRRAIST